MSAGWRSFRFEPEWRISLFTALLVPAMVGLGFWQLQRADEKAELASSFAQRQQQRPALLADLWDKPAEALAYRQVQLYGSFLPQQYFLLDNKVQAGVFGYEVLGIVQLDSGDSVLVNRGWVAGDADRQVLPSVPAVAGEVQVRGHVYVAPGVPYLLAEQHMGTTWPKRIQAVEMDKLGPAVQALAGGRIFPYPVRINAGAPGALAVDWQVVNMGPHKHQGYAVQWFAMAAVLFIFYVARSTNLWQLVSGSGRAQD